MKLYLLLLFMFIPMILIPVYGESIITATIDKTQYNRGEIIYVNGTVSNIIEDTPVSIIIKNPINNLVSISQIEPNLDGTFNFETNTYGSMWSKNGIYVIALQYQTADNSIEITFELLPAIIELTTDKYFYYYDDDIIINGTISDIDWNFDTTMTYDILNYYNNEILGTGQSNSLEQDGTFKFIINWSERELWDNHIGLVLISINMQEATKSYEFYSSNKENMENESLYEYIIDNDNDITVNQESIKLHEISMYEYDDYLLTHNNTLANHNNTFAIHAKTLDTHTIEINELKLENKNLKNEFAVFGGYLTNLNVTLGQSFPSILDSKAIKEITNENKRLEDEIILFDISIANNLISLEDATNDGNEIKIQKFTDAIGSDILSMEIANSKLSMTYLYFDLYPQN